LTLINYFILNTS
jgi:hypothetical protein